MSRHSRARRVSSIVNRTLPTISTEFTVDHVYDIRSAVVCLLDSIASFVDTQTAIVPESYANLAQQFYNLDEELFKGIHDRYLWWSRSFVDRDSSASSNLSRNFIRSAKPAIQTTSHHGFAIKYSRTEADRFLQSLLVGFEACKNVLMLSLKQRSEKETKLHEQVVDLQDQIEKREAELKLVTNKLNEGRREKGSWIEKVEALDAKLKTAGTRILELERMSDVLKWQKFSDEATNRHILAVDEMREKFEKKEKWNKKSEERLQNKIKRLESEIGKLKLRDELPMTQSSNVMLEKLDHTRQQLYIRDQKIHVLHKMMSDQQEQIAGCLHGLQEDFKDLLDKLTNGNPGRAFTPDSGNVQFQAKLRLLHDSSVKGTLQEAVSNLPPQYEPTKLDCVSPVKRPKSTSYHTTSAESSSAPKHLSDSLKPRSISMISNSAYTYPNGRKRVPIQPSLPPSFRATITAADAPTVLESNASAEDKKEKPHPKLVSRVTGRANLLEVMKHFPYLSVEQVSQQWENFRKYDKNKDFSLDLPELYEVITDVCGLKVTVSEMKEAMAEVDRDRSSNVDFYEYLKIAEMIIRKQDNMNHDDYFCLVDSDMQQTEEVRSKKRNRKFGITVNS